MQRTVLRAVRCMLRVMRTTGSQEKDGDLA
jgi:hypothetical protein